MREAIVQSLQGKVVEILDEEPEGQLFQILGDKQKQES